jgi:hypothetical protein
MEYMSLTPQEAEQFKELYAVTKAKDGDNGTFIFKGHEFLVNYAKYVIEFWETSNNENNPERN